MLLSVRDLAKRYPTGRRGDSAPAVCGICLDVPAGALFTLLGPSGCGKTTTLRCIAGLEVADAGEITVGGRVLYSSARAVNVPANRRGLGMVFQSYAIWPHMTVRENVVYPLTVAGRARRLGRREVRERAERMLAAVELDALAARPATTLSGGQQQRLALARALVAQPPLLLLDEPLSNLDAKLRWRMRLELKRLQTEIGVTALFVTHDQSEALAISDRIAVMRDGVLEQDGPPREIYERPATRFVAEFIGISNLLAGTVGPDGYTVDVPELRGMLRTAVRSVLPGGAAVVAVVRPEAIGLSAAPVAAGAGNAFTGTVLAQVYLGDAVEHLVRVAGAELRVRTAAGATVAPGEQVVLTVPAEDCLLLPAG